MGGVYLAEHLQFRRRVAIKVLLSSHRDDPRARARFEIEARAVCHLQHPNLVTYHDFGMDPETSAHFLVMECLNGVPLSTLVKRQVPVPLSRVVHIVTQICDALTVAHDAEVIHRDLKPANVMLVTHGDDSDAVKLIDFGIAHVTSRESNRRRLTADGIVIGTTAYLAPEYIQHQIVSPQTDIYALGVMTYELIAGHRPFRNSDRRQLMLMHLTKDPTPLDQLSDGRVVPRLLNNVVLRALAKEPSERFRSIRDFKAHLLAASRPLLGDEVSADTLEQSAHDLLETHSTTIDPGLELATTHGVERPQQLAGERLVRTTETGMQSGLLTVRTKYFVASWVLGVVFLVGIAGVLGFHVANRLGGESTLQISPSEPAANVSLSPVRQIVQSGMSRLLPLKRRQSHGHPMRPQLFRRGLESSSIEAQPKLPEPAVIKHVRVTVIADPYGAIFRRGKKLGNNKEALVLKEGRHCFRAYNPLYGEKRGCIRAKSGRRNVLRLKLRNPR